MCGIVGIVGQSTANQSIYDALTVLQHRGQDAAGIAIDDAGVLHTRKSKMDVEDYLVSRSTVGGAGTVATVVASVLGAL